jgi:hypothetical protein
MLDHRPSVGEALARAMSRADQLRQASARSVRVRILTRFGDYEDGLTIVARIAARTGPELEAQDGKGVRHLPLSELDARAHELPALVEAAAAEVEAAVAAAPTPSKRPNQSDGDFDLDAFEGLSGAIYKGMLSASRDLAASAGPRLSAGAVTEAVADSALRVAALSATGGQIEGGDLVEMLKNAVRETRQRVLEGVPPGERLH